MTAQSDPDVAVDEVLVRRPGRWVVVMAGALDLGALVLGRAVVQGEKQRSRRSDVAQGVAEQQPSQ